MRDDRFGVGHLDHPGKGDRADLAEDRAEDRRRVLQGETGGQLHAGRALRGAQHIARRLAPELLQLPLVPLAVRGDDRDTAGGEYAAEFPYGLGLVLDVVEHVQRADRTEGAVREGQLLDVRDDCPGEGAEDAVRDVHGQHVQVGAVLPHPGDELPVAAPHVRDRTSYVSQFVHDDAREVVTRDLPLVEGLTGGQVASRAVRLGGEKAAIGDRMIMCGLSSHRGSMGFAGGSGRTRTVVVATGTPSEGAAAEGEPIDAS